ncbi:peptidoglycan-binding protein [Glycomyces sp. TRM65418]|uniref:peptidoglycan-binding protein n=1 Tax=Glycomyces sp. TRM65418 TaxID=2867006 RepID=UPI001CE5F91C|nr:peptidoglycan-binding protein [Glycomyces sp. TRM65418]MCC3763603.1 peptidoglycan-binding protein [Glycomyces sp. TRM65418]QZD57586.1 peptidoglycan-binding protein [Glycomyces sp. TRM65418]
MTDQPADTPGTRSRRWLLRRAIMAAGGVGAATVPAVFAAGSADAAAAVDMELVLVAAMVDPPKSGTGTTLTAGPHVKVVEQALDAENFLAAGNVDGHYGTSTISAYAAWQRSLGYSGLDANGIPGPTSLAKLGQDTGLFTVSRTVNIGSATNSYGGKRVNTRTRNMLAAADAKLSWGITLTQGSYNTGNPSSAGTHDGGGVVDVNVSGMTATQRWQTVKAMRDVGFAAWLRTPEQGFSYHIHANAVGDTDMSGPAQRQVHDYFYGKNGLADHAADNTPSAYRSAFTWWEKYNR